MKKLIDLRNVNVIYKNPQGEDFHALKNVNLEINAGDYVAILGTSGSGKTTLSNIIGMLNGQYQGEYNFQDLEAHKMSERQRVVVRGDKFGFIFQDYVLLDFLTALENVALSLQYHNLPKSQIYRIAQEKLISVGLGEKIHHRPFQLSGGQKQRVSIARALTKNPKVIIADEPTGALDHNSRVEVLSLLQELNAKGVTIITVTHSEEDARAAKRIIQVEKGSIVADRLQRNRLRFFGKLLNLESQEDLDARKQIVMEHVHLSYGIDHPQSFIQIPEENCDNENKYKLLCQLKPEWLEDKNLLNRVKRWYETSDELLRSMISIEIIRAHELGINTGSFLNEVESFFKQAWEEETAMFFLQCLDGLNPKIFKPRLNLKLFFKHPSNKVRATAINFFKNDGYIDASDFNDIIGTILTDSDHRVRSNMLDHLYSLKGFDFRQLKGFNFEKDSSGRVRAIWAEMLMAIGERQSAMDILTPMVLSQDLALIQASVWVLAKDPSFHIIHFLKEKVDQNPSLLVYIDEILKTYARVKKDLMKWRQPSDSLEELKAA